jgi:hypothetical protein
MFNPLDLNHDGIVNHLDNPHPAGSEASKMWWSKVNAQSQKSITPEMKKQYGDKVVGSYNGKPLVPGEAGQGQGDFNYMVQKLMATKGMSLQSATKIAAKAKNLKYGS